MEKHRPGREAQTEPPVSGAKNGEEVRLTGHGYTDFGRVFDRLLRSRGHGGGSFAAECRRRGLKVGVRRDRDVDPEMVDDWMRGGRPCPVEIPLYADAILRLDEEERDEFGPAYAYGQKVPGRDARSTEGDDLPSGSVPDGGGRSVWLVTDGAYEDHEVVAAFDNGEAAEACVEELNRGRTGPFRVTARVEELPLLSCPPSAG
jgi:hypothetical protein